MIPTKEMEDVLNDPCSSRWLKESINKLLNRDCVDVMNDIETLSSLFCEFLPVPVEPQEVLGSGNEKMIWDELWPELMQEDM
jgi:hypothetical protein